MTMAADERVSGLLEDTAEELLVLYPETAVWIAAGAFSVSAVTTFVIWWRRPTRKR